MRHLRLQHPSLDFWIDVRVRQLNGRWLVVADLAGEPDMGIGNTPSEALWAALSSFRTVCGLISSPTPNANCQGCRGSPTLTLAEVQASG